MVWADITAVSHSPLEFIERGFKINDEYYRENMQKGALKPQTFQ